MIFAKDYHIEMLSVGAADAFILYVIDKQDNGHLILIDAGNYNDGGGKSLNILENALAELKKRIFYLSDWTMIRKVDILHEGHCGDFASYSSEKSKGLFCIVSYHHKMVLSCEKTVSIRLRKRL